MPVEKFRSFEEAERGLWNFAPDNRYYRQLRAFYEFAEKLLPRQFYPSLSKFRSFKDANATKDPKR